MDHYKIIAKNKWAEMPVGSQICESDFTLLCPDGTVVQLEHQKDPEETHPYDVYPGIWSIQLDGPSTLVLSPTEFSKEDVLSSFIHTKNITDKIDCFFNNLHIYTKYGIDIPRRNILVYGPGGTGKTSSIKIVANKYRDDENTAIILWPTDQIDPHAVKLFIKNFKYHNVTKLILIAEDLGGVEVDEVKVKSYSSLLALLDNQEKAFALPTMIIATTNHPEVFLGNIANRPGRFADKIEFGYPSADDRERLLRFFLKDRTTDGLVAQIQQKEYGEFTPDHIKEFAQRSELYSISLSESMQQVQKEIELYKKHFETNKKRIGIESPDYD